MSGSLSTLVVWLGIAGSTFSAGTIETAAGWQKLQTNPVLGGDLGTCFDVSVLREDDKFRMWFSWRPKASVALVESRDGVHWGEPVIVLSPNQKTDWEERINRPVVHQRDGLYHMWYTAQTRDRSWIGYATSRDGTSWTRMSPRPVLSAEPGWEKAIAVMCPHVLWDDREQLYRLWYSGGEQYEPNAIGYATSPDGVQWTRHPGNPVFRPDQGSTWERHKVTACQVVREGQWYVMFYIGFADEHTAQIGIARSRDGTTGWQRHPDNPIIRARVNRDAWDYDACYKPYAIFHEGRWMLWYNGRKGSVEQIGLATHPGRELWPQPDPAPASRPSVLEADAFQPYVKEFNRHDEELYVQHVDNAAAWEFLRENIPLFECPDKELEKTYYFRWWTYRKHIKHTPAGFVITEFLPAVGWAGKYNTISCPAAHHFYEGRWLHDGKYLDDYARFWFRGGGEPRRYSFWAADALWARHLVRPDLGLLVDLLPDLIANYQAWEDSRRDPNGLFWQIDDRDGMEVSIGGSGYRATINSYMYGDALAIANVAELAGEKPLARRYRDKAAQIRQLVQQHLWDREAQFYKVVPRAKGGGVLPRADVRELHGYTPWYFGLPDPEQAVAWRQLIDPDGFHAPYGPTTAERRHPKFALSYQGHECQWNGPSWPYATSVTLTSLANLLSGPPQDHISAQDYFELLKIYARSHRLKRDDGRVVPWIDENLNPLTGDWISRTRLRTWKNDDWDPGKGGKERGKDYNHSTFCDLIVSGLIGLRPRADEVIEVHPLVPPDAWDYFCLDNVRYHGHTLTILWDKAGRRYGRGAGFCVLYDGKEAIRSPKIQRLKFNPMNAAREIGAFVVKEHYGVSHPDQIIDFRLTGKTDAAEAHVIGPAGQAVVSQLLEDGRRIAVRADLPAGATRTWKLISGRGAEPQRERDLVRVIEKKQYYEITNGVTGIRIPTEGFQLPADFTAGPGLFNISVKKPFYLPAPVQGVLLRDGTWTATGPNALEALADEGSGRFDVTFLERGPLKTVVRIHYAVTTPSYDYGQLHLKDAGSGYHTTTITLTAGSQSILFEEETNLEVIYGFDVYRGVEPTNGRYRGHHATKKENGYQPDGEVYGMSHARAPMDAQVDLNYQKPRRAAYTSSGPAFQGGSWRQMAVWDPWVFDSGWYWQVFNRNKGADANIAGIFAGRPSRALGAGASGVGINTLPVGKDGKPRLLITVESYRRSASNVAFPKSRFQWGLFIGTKVRDMKPPTEVQPIARQMNLHGGVNLNKLHRLTIDFPDPPGGYGSLYMDKAAIDWRKEKIRTDEDYYRFLYNAETYSRPMIDMWRDPKPQRLQKMIDSVVDHGHKLVESLVNGDGIYNFDVHYWHGGLMMMRDGVIIDQILGDSRTSDQDRRRIKAIAALYANVLWDNDFVPLDNDHGLNLGTANMPIQQSGYRSFYAMFMSGHPSMKARAPRVVEQVMGIVSRVVNDGGAEIGCPHYMGASFAPTLSSLLQIKQLGQIDPLKAELRLARFAEFYMQLMTPPEPRLDGKRGHIPLGDGSIEPCEMLGMLGTGFRDADPQLSRRLMGMWNESGNPHSFFFGTTLAMIDGRLPSTSPNLSDASFPGYMSVLRNGYGTDDETAIWLIAGDWYSDHRHNDHGSVIIYALGQPLSTDWSSIYTPHTPGSYTKSAIVFADSIPGGWAKDSPELDAGTIWNAGSDQEVLRSFPDGGYARAFMKAGKTETTTWTREVIKILPDPQHPIIVLRDSFTGSQAGAEKVMTLNLVADGTVDTPAGVITPILRRHPNAGHNPNDLKHHRPSTSKTITLPGGVHCFGFTGSQNIDFNVYTVNDQSQEAVIGNWSAPIWGGHAKGRFESQHLLRVKGSGIFTSVIVPWRKGHAPPGLTVVTENGAVVIVLSDQRVTIDSNAYTIEREGRKTTREFR